MPWLSDEEWRSSTSGLRDLRPARHAVLFQYRAWRGSGAEGWNRFSEELLLSLFRNLSAKISSHRLFYNFVCAACGGADNGRGRSRGSGRKIAPKLRAFGCTSEAHSDFPVSQRCGRLCQRKVSFCARSAPAVYRAFHRRQTKLGRCRHQCRDASLLPACLLAGVMLEGEGKFGLPLYLTKCSESVAEEGHRTGVCGRHAGAGRTN